MDSFC